MITPDQHRKIGEILGFPSCCVEEWVNDIASPMEERRLRIAHRGAQHVRFRSDSEVLELEEKISVLLERSWEMGTEEMIYIRCTKCAETLWRRHERKICPA